MRPYISVSTTLCLWVVASAAQALEIVVTKTQDSYDAICDSDCSLREAVALASSTAGEHRIRLPAGIFMLTLEPLKEPDGWSEIVYDEDFNLNGDLDIYNSLHIVGTGSDSTVISGVGRDRLFEVLAGATLTLEKVQLRYGRHSEDGGAISNLGELHLREVLLHGNRATSGFGGARGGAVANYGLMSVSRSEFNQNYTRSGYTDDATGGAIFNTGHLQVRDSRFTQNAASAAEINGKGGALHNLGTADVARVLFSENSTFYGTGSAISNEGSAFLKLSNSSITSNMTSGESDAGTLHNGVLAATPTQTPRMQLIHVTVAGNGGAYAVENHGALSVRNSLIFSGFNEEWERLQGCVNKGPNATFSARGLMLSEGFGNCVADLPPVTDAQVFTRVLYPLADNNSSIPSFALRRGSPAVDAGVGSCASHDQRGFTRPRDGNGDGVANCDLGAYERMKP